VLIGKEDALVVLGRVGREGHPRGIRPTKGLKTGVGGNCFSFSNRECTNTIQADQKRKEKSNCKPGEAALTVSPSTTLRRGAADMD